MKTRSGVWYVSLILVFYPNKESTKEPSAYRFNFYSHDRLTPTEDATCDEIAPAIEEHKDSECDSQSDSDFENELDEFIDATQETDNFVKHHYNNTNRLFSNGSIENRAKYESNDQVSLTHIDQPPPGVIKKRPYDFKQRIPNPRGISKMRQRWSSSINDIIQNGVNDTSCCKKLRCLSKADKPYLLDKMKIFLQQNTCERRKTLASMLGSSGRFYFDGNKVCATFLWKAFRFSRDVQSSVRSLAMKSSSVNGDNSSLDAQTVSSNQLTTPKEALSNPSSMKICAAPGRESISSFLIRLAESTGDRMPDSDERHLPFRTKKEVYAHFMEEYNRVRTAKEASLPSANYFFRTWKLNCRHIKVRKTTRFTKCDTCEQLKSEIKRRVTNFESTLDLLKQQKEHFDMVSRERQEYKRKRDHASLHPTEAWSFIVDGADQTAYGLPHFTSKTKNERGQAMDVKLIGILEHSTENKLRLLTMTGDHKTGANHIVEAVHRYLMDRSLSGSPPPKLYVQVDNCTRENKNRFFLGYIECLVRWHLFKEVEVSFLPVGHTHEDIDQAFSTTSKRLNQHDAITLRDLHTELRQVYNQHTSVTHMRYVINWSDLCKQEKLLTTANSFSHYRYFQFKAKHEAKSNDALSSVSCLVKVNVSDEWSPISSLFLKSAPDLEKTPPTIIDDSRNSFSIEKQKVTERIESTEARIRDPTRIGELKQLRDSVFRKRKERFHWDIMNCIEYSKLKEISDGGTLNGDLDIAPDIEYAELSTKKVNSSSAPQSGLAVLDKGYSYEANDFVATLSTTPDNNRSFWIGKVLDTVVDKEGVVRGIKLHWFEAYSRGPGVADKFVDKYAPSYLDMGTPKQRPWTNVIEPTAVIIKFDSLLQSRRLPIAVQKHLRLSLPTLF